MAEGFSRPALLAFELFFRPWMLRRVQIDFPDFPDLDPDLPVIFAANHTSWWDPFVLREAHRRVRPDAPIYTLMLESELRSRPFFRRIGIVGIDPSSPASVRRAIRVLKRRIASNPASVTSYFPQGRIWPATKRPLDFRRGISLFAAAMKPVQVVPTAIRVEALNRPAATIFLRMSEPLLVTRQDDNLSTELEGRVEALLDKLGVELDRRGEAAADLSRADPTRPHA